MGELQLQVQPGRDGPSRSAHVKRTEKQTAQSAPLRKLKPTKSSEPFSTRLVLVRGQPPEAGSELST
jgi:hypothetical protein